MVAFFPVTLVLAAPIPPQILLWSHPNPDPSTSSVSRIWPFPVQDNLLQMGSHSARPLFLQVQIWVFTEDPPHSKKGSKKKIESAMLSFWSLSPLSGLCYCALHSLPGREQLWLSSASVVSKLRLIAFPSI
ncbi:hypothetical protein CIB84_004828 [Bambusicola thoracicus]|uniref:Uncharacterized protein n=1 Tax=Bambusicola thoracicus TaxID=9083 RepID=A0A2P4T4Y1_BAMTH|nr:hypothetical protein CIB84_004828 [Bambusicola thoracicus]